MTSRATPDALRMCSSPATARNNEVLPHPEGPISTPTWPAAIASDTPSTAGRLSPAAILVGSAGRGADDKPLVKVSGFGLGRWGADGEEPDFECRAPEQFADPDHSGPQADLYSLGCVLHTLLAGRAPFPASCAAEAGWHHLHSAPPALADLRPDVPAPLARFVLRLLGKDPALRPATAADASRFLQMYADGDESGDTVEFAEAHAVTSGAASVISRSLSGPFADLPHEPLFADDLSPEPTMVLDTADPPTPRTALGERTPLAVAKRKSKRILPKAADRRKPARPQYGRPEAVNRFALAGLVVGVCLGVLFAIVCILKIYAATKG